MVFMESLADLMSWSISLAIVMRSAWLSEPLAPASASSLARESTERTPSMLLSDALSALWALATLLWLPLMPDSSESRRRSWAAAVGSSEGWLTRRPVEICSCVSAIAA